MNIICFLKFRDVTLSLVTKVPASLPVLSCPVQRERLRIDILQDATKIVPQMEYVRWSPSGKQDVDVLPLRYSFILINNLVIDMVVYY